MRHLNISPQKLAELIQLTKVNVLTMDQYEELRDKIVRDNVDLKTYQYVVDAISELRSEDSRYTFLTIIQKIFLDIDSDNSILDVSKNPYVLTSRSFGHISDNAQSTLIFN